MKRLFNVRCNWCLIDDKRTIYSWLLSVRNRFIVIIFYLSWLLLLPISSSHPQWPSSLRCRPRPARSSVPCCCLGHRTWAWSLCGTWRTPEIKDDTLYKHMSFTSTAESEEGELWHRKYTVGFLKERHVDDRHMFAVNGRVGFSPKHHPDKVTKS